MKYSSNDLGSGIGRRQQSKLREVNSSIRFVDPRFGALPVGRRQPDSPGERRQPDALVEAFLAGQVFRVRDLREFMAAEFFFAHGRIVPRSGPRLLPNPRPAQACFRSCPERCAGFLLAHSCKSRCLFARSGSSTGRGRVPPDVQQPARLASSRPPSGLLGRLPPRRDIRARVGGPREGDDRETLPPQDPAPAQGSGRDRRRRRRESPLLASHRPEMG